MSRTVVIKGHMVGPTTVQLEQPLPEQAREVEVRAELPDDPGRRRGRLSEFLRSLPPGTRTKEDVDQQVREERNSWS